jgi:S-adenosylmethionine:tRNA ribosyltransferase-isomerase
MHAEWVEIPAATAAAIMRAKLDGRRVIAVGTTTVRALEGAAKRCGGRICAWHGDVDLFITPGFVFQVVDALLTNFHLPSSTLLVLVSAFAGRAKILRAYKEAVRRRYRFYSFGDAMLII